jgi:hypothetical protein
VQYRHESIVNREVKPAPYISIVIDWLLYLMPRLPGYSVFKESVGQDFVALVIPLTEVRLLH